MGLNNCFIPCMHYSWYSLLGFAWWCSLIRWWISYVIFCNHGHMMQSMRCDIVGRMRLEYFDKISCAHTLRCRGQTARHLTRDQLALAMTGPFQFLSFLSSTFSFLDFFFLFFSWGLYSWRGCFQSPWLFLGVGRYVRRTSRYIFCVLTKRIIRCPLTKLVSNPSSYIATDFVFVFASDTAIT